MYNILKVKQDDMDLVHDAKKSGNASQSQGISFLNVFSLFFFQIYLSKTGPTCRQKPLAIFLDGLFKSELELKISQKNKTDQDLG